MTKKDIKRYIELGLARDITNESPDYVKSLHTTTEGLAFGVYGVIAGLFRDTTTGDLYAITARNSNLLILA